MGLIQFFTEIWPIQVSLENNFMSLFCKKKRSLKATESITSISDTLIDPSESGNNEVEEVKTATPMHRQRRKTLTQYTKENVSLSDILTRVKENLVNSKDISQQMLFSNKDKNLGMIYKSEIELRGVKQQVAVRLIEFTKTPKYLLESLYLEMAYYKENRFAGLVPIEGLSCEPPKLYILTPWLKNSLHQFIYAKERTLPENLKIIK
eukprot:TRINITY_DN6953_c0_g1_i11.p1 TRINITY_DN6953_c0_g1~~TRINITY_DN6953_c0_g1_i11.p1  ORF type:complete len:207 (-),score=60.12 TRINITY_DN6953_c0_g1_i11:543-1163(-)